MSSPDRARGLSRLVDTVARLRGERGCPWDREQTVESLKPYLVEETYELLDAIDSGDADRHAEELGDVLLQVVLQAQIRAEQAAFTIDDVAHRLCEKLIRRHPHVFGDTAVSDAQEVLRNWEIIKRREHNGTGRSALDGLPRHLPALQKAQRIQSRAARLGFDWPDAAGVLDKIVEEIEEVRRAADAEDAAGVAEEMGDLLFSIVNLCRFLGVDAEQALRAANAKFGARFRAVERRVQRAGGDMHKASLDELEAHWQAVKDGEGVGH